MTNGKTSVIIYESHVDAGMAQSVEHVIGNDEVISSILITSSKSRGQSSSGFYFIKNPAKRSSTLRLGHRERTVGVSPCRERMKSPLSFAGESK